MALQQIQFISIILVFSFVLKTSQKLPPSCIHAINDSTVSLKRTAENEFKQSGLCFPLLQAAGIFDDTSEEPHETSPKKRRLCQPDISEVKETTFNESSSNKNRTNTEIVPIPNMSGSLLRSVDPSKRKTFVVKSFSDLHDEFKKRILKADITEEEAERNLQCILNILHFKTKHNFYTLEQYNNRHKQQQYRRYNSGPSKVSPHIVSVAPLEKEQEELISKDFRKKDYKVICQIGKGGFGKVYMVKSYKDKKKIAVKKMPHVTPKQQRKNFQEMRFLRYCNNHPNVVKYLRSYLVADEVWLLTEYMQGGTLTQAVAVHQFTEPEIAFIAKQVLKALDFLHDNQLMHRDLKSANIMLDFNGNVKLIDFGLCSDTSQGEVVHMVGSPFWMPPEMILRQPHGLPVDVWSFAICLLELANGHPPHRKSSIKAMFVAVTKGYPQPFEEPHKWSNEFKDFVSRCLVIDPKKRWTVKQLLQHDWLKCAASQTEMEKLFKNIFVANKLKFNGM